MNAGGIWRTIQVMVLRILLILAMLLQPMLALRAGSPCDRAPEAMCVSACGGAGRDALSNTDSCCDAPAVEPACCDLSGGLAGELAQGLSGAWSHDPSCGSCAIVCRLACTPRGLPGVPGEPRKVVSGDETLASDRGVAMDFGVTPTIRWAMRLEERPSWTPSARARRSVICVWTT